MQAVRQDYRQHTIVMAAMSHLAKEKTEQFTSHRQAEFKLTGEIIVVGHAGAPSLSTRFPPTQHTYAQPDTFTKRDK
jgi:hypothetical protein